MTLDNLPDIVCVHVIDFLLPCDVHALGTVCTTFQSYIGRSLNNSLALVFKNSNINFKCLDPLHSFTSLTRAIPAPRSVCIRWVYVLPTAVCWGSYVDLPYCVLLLLSYSSLLLSGSAGVQAVTGLIWNDADLDIYCTSIAAPFVRRWLIGRELNQAFGGYSEVSYKR